MRIRVVVVVVGFGVFLGVWGVTAHPARAGALTNDFAVNESANPCDLSEPSSSCTPSALGGVARSDFGQLSAGGFNSTNGSGVAQINWEHNGFGLYATGATNTTVGNEAGGGIAAGSFLESVLVPAQQGHLAGEAANMLINYHLDGGVDIDFGGVGTSWVQFAWVLVSFPVGCDASCTFWKDQNLFDQRWEFSHFSTTIDQDIVAEVPFHYGEPLYLSMTAQLSAFAGNTLGVGAQVGHATGDFLHTATMKPAIIEDLSGHVLDNPIIISDSGFDYAHPAPEPSALVLVAAAALGVCARRACSR